MKAAGLLREIAFVVHPVSDITIARAFYEEVLGLTATANWEDQWIEYDIGAGTLAITTANESHRPGSHGPSVALEVTDFDGVIAVLNRAGVNITRGPWDSPACRSCIIRDPDQNEIMLHARKENRRRTSADQGTVENAAMDSSAVQTVKDFIMAINSRDLTGLSRLMTDDHTFVDPQGTTTSGRDKMLCGWWRYFAMFPDYVIRVESMVPDGSAVAVFGSWSGTYAGTNGPLPENAVGGPAAWRAVVDDRRISTWQVYAEHSQTVEVIKRCHE